MPDNAAPSAMNAAPSTQASTTGSSNAAAPGIDVEKLADKVYALLLAETRLDLARTQGRSVKAKSRMLEE